MVGDKPRWGDAKCRDGCYWLYYTVYDFTFKV